MSKRKRKGIVGVGIGAHHHVSPMGHATRTKTKREMRERADKRDRAKGWAS